MSEEVSENCEGVKDETNYDTCCRLCLCSEQSIVSIFDNEQLSKDFQKKIIQCVQVSVTPNDKLSKLICELCIDKVNNWFEFKTKTQQAQQTLKTWYSIKYNLNLDDDLDQSSKNEDDEFFSDESNLTFLKRKYKDESGGDTARPAKQQKVIIHKWEKSCYVCLRKFSSRFSAMRHETNLHGYTRGDDPPPDRLLKHFKSGQNGGGDDGESDFNPFTSVPRVYNCLMCTEKFDSDGDCLNHELQVHPDYSRNLTGDLDERDEHDEETKEEFEKRNHLVIQMLTNALECSYCLRKVTHVHSLIGHLRAMHGMTIPNYQCFYCCASLRNRTNSQAHGRSDICKLNRLEFEKNQNYCVHDYRMPFKCRQCGDKFVEESQCKRHFMEAHMHPVECACLNWTNSDQNDQNFDTDEGIRKDTPLDIIGNIKKVEKENVIIEQQQQIDDNHDNHDDDDDDENEKNKLTTNNNNGNNMMMDEDDDKIKDDDNKMEVDNDCNDKKVEKGEEKEVGGGSGGNKWRTFNNYEQLEQHYFEKNCLITCTNCKMTFENLDQFSLEHECYANVCVDLKISNKSGGGDDDDDAETQHVTCDLCQEEVKTQDDLTQHRQLYHQFNCLQCQLTYNTLGELEEHMDGTHSSEDKIYSCATCLETFEEGEQLMRHIRTEHDKQFNCEICVKNFESESDLQKHLRRHNQRAQLDTNFYNLDSLVEKDKTYTCAQCYEPFVDMKRLIKHRNVHKVDAYNCYNCQFCPARFRTNKRLYLHKRTMHAQEQQQQQQLQQQQHHHRQYSNSYLDDTQDESVYLMANADDSYIDESFSIKEEEESGGNNGYDDDGIVSYDNQLHSAIDIPKQETIDDEYERAFEAEDDEEDDEDDNYGELPDVTSMLEERMETGGDDEIIDHNNFDDEQAVDESVLDEYIREEGGGGSSELEEGEAASSRKMVTIAMPPRLNFNQDVQKYREKYPNAVECDICHKWLANPPQLYKHKKYTNCSHAVKFQMAQADSFFGSSGDHFLSAGSAPTTPRTYTCDNCDRNFDNSQDYSDHMRDFHPDIRPKTHWCNICNKNFMTAAALVSHKKSHTRQVTPSVAAVAAAGGGGTIAVLAPQQLRGGASITPIMRQKVFKCSLCSASFSDNNAYTRHIEAHLNERMRNKQQQQHHSSSQMISQSTVVQPYWCEVCNKRFPTSQALGNHKRVHNPKKTEHFNEANQLFVCPVCKKGFTTNSALGNHKKIHIRGVPTLPPGITLTETPKFNVVNIESLKASSNGSATTTGGISVVPPHKLFPIKGGGSSVKEPPPLVTITPKVPQQVQCKICGQKYDSRISLSNHMRLHKNRDELQFMFNPNNKHNLAGAPINKSAAAAAHAQQQQVPKHKCNLCKGVFLTTQALLSHRKTHFPNNKLNQQNETLQDSLASLYATNNTNNQSPPTPPTYGGDINSLIGTVQDSPSPPIGQYSCSTCHKTYPDLISYRRHARYHPEGVSINGNQLVVCQECRGVFENVQQLKKHMIQRHGGGGGGGGGGGTAEVEIKAVVKQKICHYCNFKFDSDDKLNAHMKNYHKIGSAEGVASGGAPVASSRTLAANVVPVDVVEHSCNLCHISFKNAKSLDAHVDTYHPLEMTMLIPDTIITQDND